MLDLAIGVMLLIGLAWGWHKGLFLQLASLVGAITGFIIACFVYARFGRSLIAPDAGVSTHLMVFILLWVGIPLALTLVAKLLGGVLGKLHMGWINKSLGGVVGLLKVSLFLSVLFTGLEFLCRYDPNPMLKVEDRQHSLLYYPVQKLAGHFIPSEFWGKTVGKVTNRDNERNDREE